MICYLENYIIVGVLKVVVELFIWYLVVEFVFFGIVVNVVFGGLIEIDVLNYFFNCEELLKDVISKILVGWMIEFNDLVNVVLFFVSEKVDMICG